MAEQVKMLGLKRSPYSCRVEIALKLKGVKYEFIEEDLSNKSDDLLKYNPVYKKVPVLLHNGKAISESVIIVEYIDVVWNGPSILPEDPYDKAVARFWAKFIDDKHRFSVGEMAEQVKILGSKRSPYSCRVEIALKLKGVQYEFIQEDLSNKSDDLLKYNPVHKKVPVLLHNGKAISESVIIVEYIDAVWNGPSILPEDPYDKAAARFWAKFIDDKLSASIRKTFFGKGEEQEKAIEETTELLKTLETQLKGKKFFGGDTIGLVDIVADLIGDWLPELQEVTGIEVVTKEKFPQLTEWMDDFVTFNTVKECLPKRDVIVNSLRALFGKA